MLSDLIPKISNYNLEIVICDNASTDNTKGVVEKYMAIYPHITYFRQSSNIIDKNFVTCYELASSKYIWLLGDSSRIVDIHFPKIIELLSSGELSAITMNAAGRVTDVKSKSFTDPIELLSELGWHLGLISSMIVLKAMTEKTYLPHQQRVIEEKRELDEKLQKLTLFISSEKFCEIVRSEEERGRLVCQEGVMKYYSEILGGRIAAVE